jgi:hypothetical protein
VKTPCDVCGGECCQYFILDYQRPDMGIPRFKDTLDGGSRRDHRQRAVAA